MLPRLSIAFVEVKVGNISEKLLNKGGLIVHCLY